MTSLVFCLLGWDGMVFYFTQIQIYVSYFVTKIMLPIIYKMGQDLNLLKIVFPQILNLNISHFTGNQLAYLRHYYVTIELKYPSRYRIRFPKRVRSKKLATGHTLWANNFKLAQTSILYVLGKLISPFFAF